MVVVVVMVVVVMVVLLVAMVLYFVSVFDVIVLNELWWVSFTIDLVKSITLTAYFATLSVSLLPVRLS